jgi:hypothetical protein
VSLTNVLPAGAMALATICDAATCDTSNGLVVCSFPSFLAHTSAVVAIRLGVEPVEYFTNITRVGSSDLDLDPINNIAVVVVPIAGASDFDGDGLPDWWELANGTNPRQPDGNDDLDHDGLTSLQEYLAGTNPHDPNSGFRITGFSLEVGNHSALLSFLAVSNRSYSILGASNPVSGPWEKVLDIPAAPVMGIVTTNFSIAQPMRFYRVATPSQP